MVGRQRDPVHPGEFIQALIVIVGLVILAILARLPAG